MKATFYSLAACAALLLSACGPAGGPPAPAVDTAKIVDSIKTGEVKWNKDWAAKDSARIASHYAPDAVVMNPGSPIAVGAPAIKAGLDQAVADPGFTLKFVSDKVDVAASGDLAASHGTYQLTATDPKTKTVGASTGSYVAVYRPRADGVWQAVWDIATPGPPASIGATMAGAGAAKSAQ